MKVEKIDFSEADCFSESFLHYMSGDQRLEDFYGRAPKIEEFEAQTDAKTVAPEIRKTLVQVLKKQYQGMDVAPAVEANIESLLESHTFTITTGHQLNLFTGPLYFIYKIITAINACERLQSQYPDKKFVPVYWMASEDHDFDEISHFRFDGKKYQWKTDQTGAVGRFDPRELATLLKEFPANATVFEKAYLEQETLANSVRYYVNELLGAFGIVVLDADDRELKSHFVNVMRADIFDHRPQDVVTQTSEELSSAGFKTQVHAREINFFYLEDGLRTRIEKVGDSYGLVDSERRFSKEEIEDLMAKSPENFSPNVILRPLYQEMILPNLAYIGGPSELVYWLQLKGIFDLFKVEFPILMPRNFAMIIPSHLRAKWEKTGLESKALFRPMHQIARELTLRYSDKDLELNGMAETVDGAFASIRKQAEGIDSTLGPMVEAETVRMRKSLAKIEKKMIRAEKRRMSDRIGQAAAVKDWLFPGGGLQERKDNFLNFFLQDKDFNGELKKHLDPFDFRFHVLAYE